MNLKRYSLVIADSLFAEVQQTAEEEHTSIVDLLRRYVKLGLHISKIASNPDTHIIIRNGEGDREILFFL